MHVKHDIILDFYYISPMTNSYYSIHYLRMKFPSDTKVNPLFTLYNDAISGYTIVSESTCQHLSDDTWRECSTNIIYSRYPTPPPITINQSILNLSIVMSTRLVNLPMPLMAIDLHPQVSGWMHHNRNGSLPLLR